MRLPVMRSAQVSKGADAINVTPVTTLYDQFRAAGLSRSAAASRLHVLVADRCGAAAAVEVDAARTGNQPFATAARDWLLPALDAYLEAMRGVGIWPATPGIDWSAQLDAHASLLSQMCGVARNVWSDAWLSDARYQVAAARQLAVTSTALDTLATTRPHVTAQVLTLIGRSLAAQEFPELAGALQSRAQIWQGKEAALAITLAQAQLLQQAPTNNANATADTNPPAVKLAKAVFDVSGAVTLALKANATAVGSQAPGLRLQNSGTADRLVRLDVNATSLQDLDGVLADVLAIPAAKVREPLHRRAWRYVLARTRHDWPLSAGLFLHQPDMFLRSVGAGLCDDVSNVLHWIRTGPGYESRVRSLEGHVAPEVKIDGRWETYDPDFGVYYMNRQGQVAGVDELAADPLLITQPLLPMAPMDSTAYSQYLADIYSTTGDSFVYAPYAAPLQATLGNQFKIAAKGGYLDVKADDRVTLPTWGGGTVTLVPMRMWFPPGYTGSVDLPMVLADVSGDATVTMLGQSMEVGDAGVPDVINAYYRTAPDAGITNVRLDRVGPNGVTLTLLANALLFTSPRSLGVAAYGDDRSGLSLVNPVTTARR